MHKLLNPEKQKKALLYETEKRKYGVIGSVISFIYLLIFYFSGLSSYIVDSFPTLSPNYLAVIYLFIFITGNMLVSIPLSYVSGFKHEHNWSFSNQSLKSWVSDQLKGYLIGLIIGIPIAILLIDIIHYFPGSWWFIASVTMALIGIIFTTLFPVLILPLFNKYTPIEDEALKEKLTKILEGNGLNVSGFFVQDMSIRTKKENAFLAGLGKTRRVVLADTLLDNMDHGEIESVIAHEVGHYRYSHLWKNIFLSTIQQFILFGLLDIIIKMIFPVFPFTIEYTLWILPVFLIVLNLLSFVMNPFSLWISRKFEHQADRFALLQTKEPDAFESAMAGLANRNLSNAYPKWWVKIFYYSHPPIGERLEGAEKFRAILAER